MLLPLVGMVHVPESTQGTLLMVMLALDAALAASAAARSVWLERVPVMPPQFAALPGALIVVVPLAFDNVIPLPCCKFSVSCRLLHVPFVSSPGAGLAYGNIAHHRLPLAGVFPVLLACREYQRGKTPVA